MFGTDKELQKRVEKLEGNVKTLSSQLKELSEIVVMQQECVNTLCKYVSSIVNKN